MSTHTTQLWNSLEIAKLLVSFLTPIVIIIIGFLINRIGRRLESIQWANRTIIEKRIRIYDELAPKLNDLYCFFTFVGNWKELTPIEIISSKRFLDKQIHISAPLFSQKFKTLYDEFFGHCFVTYSGFGKDSLLRSSINAHSIAAGHKWESSWNELFSDELKGAKEAANREAIRKSYEKLMGNFSIELGLGLENR